MTPWTIIKKDPVFLQQLLSISGYTLGKIDGIIGEKTRLALKQWESDHAQDTPLDKRSESNLISTNPTLAKRIRQLVRELNLLKESHVWKVTGGTRSYADQNKLYAQGRSTSGKIITNAKGGQSYHNFGIAVDLTLFINGTPNWDNANYTPIKPLALKQNLDWGGNWKFVDAPHLQYTAGSIAYIKSKFEKGTPIAWE